MLVCYYISLFTNYHLKVLANTDLVSRGQTSFLALGVIACSISAQPKKRVWSDLHRQVVLTPPCRPEVLICWGHV